MKELYEGNLIYLKTYKNARDLRKQLVLVFKNKYAVMSEFEKAKVKAEINAWLVDNPNSIPSIIKKELMAEVDNG